MVIFNSHIIIIFYQRVMIYIPMHRADLFIVNGADLEYTKKLLKLNDAVLEYIY